MHNASTTSAKSTVDLGWQMFVMFAVIIGASMLPELVYALPPGGGGGGTTQLTGNPFQTVLCKIVGFFTGTIGKAIATIAVIMVGIGALMGKISWGLAFIVAIGIALVFGASGIIATLTDSGPGTGC